MPQIFAKDPDAILDYEIDWSSWLGSDTISASTWFVSSGLTKVSDAHTNTTTAITVSGGTVGSTETATNHVTTAGGYEDDRTIYFMIGEK